VGQGIKRGRKRGVRGRRKKKKEREGIDKEKKGGGQSALQRQGFQRKWSFTFFGKGTSRGRTAGGGEGSSERLRKGLPYTGEVGTGAL